MVISVRYMIRTIATDDLKFRIFLLDVFDHVDLVDGVALGRVLEDKRQNIIALLRLFHNTYSL